MRPSSWPGRSWPRAPRCSDRSSVHSAKCSLRSPRKVSRSSQSGSGFTNTKPAHTPTRSWPRPSCCWSICGKSHGDGTKASEPSRFQVKPWKGQRSCVDVAGLGHELPSPMATGVPERPDLVRRAAHEQDRLVADLVERRVADLGDLLLAARHLPDPAPQPLLLQLVEGPTRVASHRDVVVPEPSGPLLPEDRRCPAGCRPR